MNKIIERVPDNQIAKESGKTHYLAHRPVIRKDKETTEIRTVFDASCSNNGMSLNCFLNLKMIVFIQAQIYYPKYLIYYYGSR